MLIRFESRIPALPLQPPTRRGRKKPCAARTNVPDLSVSWKRKRSASRSPKGVKCLLPVGWRLEAWRTGGSSWNGPRRLSGSGLGVVQSQGGDLDPALLRDLSLQGGRQTQIFGQGVKGASAIRVEPPIYSTTATGKRSGRPLYQGVEERSIQCWEESIGWLWSSGHWCCSRLAGSWSVRSIQPWPCWRWCLYGWGLLENPHLFNKLVLKLSW